MKFDITDLREGLDDDARAVLIKDTHVSEAKVYGTVEAAIYIGKRRLLSYIKTESDSVVIEVLKFPRRTQLRFRNESLEYMEHRGTPVRIASREQVIAKNILGMTCRLIQKARQRSVTTVVKIGSNT
ncbi:MAG: hypothetical protein A2846_00650 [Candidatus Doudnabacteria bacterium RIFCSPHIGHO2_01_FULL_49_9]|uniref:Uncharacterized protein n=1 Tax=Candidatus Doudnabacteria bacterium RIFCSPHIGHO2_01_FULL_49_9 TaxID=1817827 RepID=A0A1F5NYV0_9BACT|nr:MAG: hypothetical protein A2846_00650 [Candidatus Doudnabacteria bacterium RIFCSPHIGHO2_01_FULL_49_9]